MATAGTRPTWADDNDGDEPGSDPAMLADIERALTDRGYQLDQPRTVPNSDAGLGAVSSPASNTATDPGSQPEGADAGELPASANADLTATGADQGQGTDQPPAPGTPQEQGHAAPETPASSEPQTPTTFDVVLPSGDHWAMTNEQANYFIQLTNWLDQVPDDIKAQWREIEQGSHVTISREDRQAFDAWVAAGRPTGQAAPPTLQRPADFDTSFLPDNMAEYVQRLEQEARDKGAPTSAVSPPAPTPNIAEIQAAATAQANRAVQVQQALDQSQAAIRDKYQLSPEQLNHLTRATQAMNIIPGIANQYRQYSPLGDLIAEAPMGQVFTQAMEVAMSSDPTLRPVYEQYIVDTHMANNQGVLQGVAAKKANASSLASAPSAAVPGTAIDPRKMTAQQRHEAMVAELAEAMGTPSQGQ